MQCLTRSQPNQFQNAIASQIITSSINLENGFELHRLAESVAFGTSMGAQLSTVLDRSLDYEK